MLKYNEENASIWEMVKKLPLNQDYLPLYFEILKSSTSPIIWGDFSEFLSDYCNSNQSFMTIIMDLLEDPKTEGARGCLLSALARFETFEKRAIDIVFHEICFGNLECRNKAIDILSIVYNSVNNQLKLYIKTAIGLYAEDNSEKNYLMKCLKFKKENFYYDDVIMKKRSTR